MNRLFALVSIFIISSCAEQDGPVAPNQQTHSLGVATVGASLDDRFVQVDQLAPGFGGMYMEDNELVVYVLSLEQTNSTRQALRSVFPEHEEKYLLGSVQYKVGNHRFSDLFTWRSKINSILGEPGVLSTDIDEVNNRIVIGVEDQNTMSVAASFARSIGVPEDATEIVLVAKPVLLSSLRDAVRPVQGGVQIDGPKLCTLGFNATLDGQALLITNSHCSDVTASLDGSDFYQPFPSTHFIGEEVLDPAFTVISGCPSGKTCRKSDSAAIEVVDSVSTNLGEVARTAVGTGSVNIVGTLYITGESSSPLFGTSVGKIGRSTGWTEGTITATCQDVTYDPGKILLCQHSSSASVNSGDSGSPLFIFTGGVGDNQIGLVGIVWGGGSGSSLISPMNGVRHDLGQLEVVYPGCPPPQIGC